VRDALLLFAFALAVTLAMAGPVLESPAERLVGREIVGRHHDAYTMVRHFEQPSRQPFSQPVTDRVGSALARFMGGVPAYNLLVLATFPLAALFGFLLARYLTLPGWAAALAGLAFAFAPAHLAHAAYHPHVAQTQWIPLYLLALLRCLDRWSPGRAAGLLLAGGLLTLSNFYFGLFGALLTPVVLLAHRPPRVGGERGRSRAATLATLAVGGAAGWLYLRLTAGSLAVLAERFAFPRADLERYGARWYSYLLPPVDHPLAGDWSSELWRQVGVADGLVEQQLTLGLALIALAALGVASWWRRRQEAPAGRAVPWLLVLAGAAWMGSLAPPAGGPWPGATVAGLLHSILPMFRAYARFGLFVQLAVALLAAAGITALWRRGRWGRWVALALVLLAAVELAPFPPWRWHHVLPTEAHRWLARRPVPWQLLDCVRVPPAVAQSVSRFLPQPAAVLSPQLPDCVEPELPGKLAALGYSHLLLRRGEPAERWLDVRPLPAGLEEEARFADSRLLRVTAAPAEIYLGRWHGFSWREFAGARSFRWLGESGGWQLVHRGERRARLGLELELWSLGVPRELELELDGEPLATLHVARRPGRHVVGPFDLAPGRHRLAWRPGGAAQVPHELLHNGDLRRLTVALGGWRWLPMPASALPGD
jgi:hypothetical protein